MPGRAKSSAEISASGAPNAPSARITRGAFAGVGSTQISRSPVARGRPCSANAYAPTTRKRTSAAMNSRNRSTKSGFIGQVASQSPDLLAQLPDPQDALGLRYLHPELEVMAVGVRGRRVPAHGHPRRTFSRVIGRHEALSLDRRADSLLQRYSAFACPSRQLRTCSKAKCGRSRTSQVHRASAKKTLPISHGFLRFARTCSHAS